MYQQTAFYQIKLNGEKLSHVFNILNIIWAIFIFIFPSFFLSLNKLNRNCIFIFADGKQNYRHHFMILSARFVARSKEIIDNNKTCSTFCVHWRKVFRSGVILTRKNTEEIKSTWVTPTVYLYLYNTSNFFQVVHRLDFHLIEFLRK